MKINKSSWHYRFIMLVGDQPAPRDLCAYARSFLLSVAIVLLAVLLMLSIAGVLFFMPVIAAYASNVFLTVGLMAVWTYLFAQVSNALIETLLPKEHWLNTVIWKSEAAPIDTTILHELAQGIKDKYCPLIEYESE